jgi:hypothetical protein
MILKNGWEEELGLTPMLIKAMMTRIDRENMIEFRGMGVPIVVTCYPSVRCMLPAVSDGQYQPYGTKRRRAEPDLSLMTKLDETQRRGR